MDQGTDEHISTVFEIIEKIKASERGGVERVRRIADGSRWIRRIYPEDKREIFKTLSSIDSPYIPHIEQIEFTDNTTIIEQEVEGSLLSECLLTRNLSPKEVLSISKQLLAVLSELQAHSIIHRDIKPDNIILTEQGHVFLIDFGIARIYRKDSTRDTSLFGTAGYAAPEQYGFAQTDPRSDLYSVGMVIKELCEAAGLKERDRLYQFALRCSSFDPNQRYGSAEEAVRELQRVHKRLFIFVPAVLLLLFLTCGVVLIINWKQTSHREVAASEENAVTKSIDEPVSAPAVSVAPPQAKKIETDRSVDTKTASQDSTTRVAVGAKTASPVTTIAKKERNESSLSQTQTTTMKPSIPVSPTPQTQGHASLQDAGVRVDIVAVTNDESVFFNVSTTTRPKEIFYKFSPEGEYRSTGFLQYADPETGGYMPNKGIRTMFADSITIYIKYTGVDGRGYGPFTTKLDMKREVLNVVKRNTLTEYINWVEFGWDSYADRVVLSTSIFASQGSFYAVEKIMYGINTKIPDREKRPLGEGRQDTGNGSGRLGELENQTVDFVSMQVFFKDGTKSDVRIYKNPHREKKSSQ